MTSGRSVLVQVLASAIAECMLDAPRGHCVRIDDVDSMITEDLATELHDMVPDTAVHVLSRSGAGEWGITAERAIEIRNRKETACLLLVPAGEGHAASSLDNSFERIASISLYQEAEHELRGRLTGTALAEPVQRLMSRFRTRQSEWWAEYLSELVVAPTAITFGRELWRIGLVPDLSDEAWTRVELNRAATRAISQPTRPTASLDERFSAAGLVEGAWRAPLRSFCESSAASLANPRRWGKEILDNHPELAFDKWNFADVVRDDLEGLEIEPFLKADGTLDKSSKLALGGDGQLVLQVPDGKPASLVVKWTTNPPKVASIAKWLLEVLPPSDMRTDETEPLASQNVRGDVRRGTVKVSLDEDSLAQGTRFVVVVTALGDAGERIDLTDGSPASADSQEFQVVAAGDPEVRTRRAAAVSLADAAMKAALDGMDDLSEDLVTWDLAGQVFGVRLGNRRAVQIRVSDVIVGMQRELTGAPQRAVHYSASGSYGSVLGLADFSRRELELPPALKKARGDVLSSLRSLGARDTVESARWTPELIAQVRSYVGSFRRALDAAEPEQLKDLLAMDAVSLAVRSSNREIRCVILLPVHPLRMLWVAEHDALLRNWAEQLTQVEPKGSRRSVVDAMQVSRVIPANLPFVLPDADGRLAAYAEELTHGTGLYLVPSEVDTEAAAEAVASVLALPRVGSTLRASAGMVAERIRAYEDSHDPSGTLRLLALHPGSGELVAGALGHELDPGKSGEDGVDETPIHRFEVIAYSDSASYTRPVPALLDLQRSVRNQDSRNGSHLFPPLSLSVRPADRMLDDPEPAHLAVVQDIGTPGLSVAAASDRQPSFRDLLVPVVTRSHEDAGDIVWDSVPATGGRPGRPDSDLTAGHRAHQRAVGRLAQPASTDVPVVRVTLDGDRLARIRTAHERADWVIGVDRFVGVDLFEGGPGGTVLDSYILDYAPDFVEGIGDRLTVTTNNRDEVEALLSNAMSQLNLEAVDQSVGGVLRNLSVVSGRLALRLLGDTSFAREAVSLAAVVAHLRERGELEGLIIVPVDAHPEIFGPSARESDMGARRCDLLFVRVGQRSFKIECVEVKSRLEARLPKALADRIVEQLVDTQRLLESRYFASAPPRIDGELQRARLASVLHYYADRSVAHGIIGAEKIEEVHRFIDRIEETGEAAEISLKGYIISLDGDRGFQKRYGDVVMNVVTADDLGKIGLTTRRVDSVVADNDEEEPATEAEEGASAGSPGEPDDREAGSAVASDQSPERDESPSTGADRIASDRSDADRPEAEQGPTPDDEAERATPESVAERPVEAARADSSVPDTVEVLLGQVEGGSDVTWRVSTKGSPHAFIIGIPGQGKSVTTRRIIREFAAQSLPSVVFDFHGDMASNPPAGATVLNAAEGLPFSPFEPDVSSGRRINVTAWEIAEVIGYVAKLGEIQRNHVYKALVAAYGAHGWEGTTIGATVPSLEEFGDALEVVETGARGKNARDRLRPFTDFGLFADGATGGFRIREGHEGLVLDVSKIGLEEVQRFAASFLLRRIYREMFAWGQADRLRLAVVLDEAHRLSRDVTLPKIMKEGRKYGVSVVVASQSADDFHADVLGNAGAKIVFRTNFPASKNVSGFLRGRTGTDLSQEIEKLNVGVAFVSTPDSAQARRVYMAE